MSRIASGDLVRTETGVCRRLQRLEDLRHHPVAALDPLVGIGVRPQRHQFPLPARPRQLRPQQLRHVDLDNDLPLEVAAGVKAQVGMGLTGEAVMTDHTVGDEVPGSGGDVEHRELESDGSIATTPSFAGDFSAIPSTDRLRVIAGSVRCNSRICSRKPPSRRTLRAPIEFGASTVYANPSRVIPSAVLAMISGSLLEIRRAPLRHPSASKMPATKPRSNPPRGSLGQAIKSRTPLDCLPGGGPDGHHRPVLLVPFEELEFTVGTPAAAR